LGTVPLVRTGGALMLGGAGTPVEWLVKMVRLPRERSLDRLAAAGALDDGQLRTLVDKLARFYEAAARAPWDGRAYRRGLAKETEVTAAELAAPALELDTERIEAIAAELVRRLAVDAPAFHARVAEGRVVDAHGDLRPEHVFLLAEPQIIDCLEFSAELRLLDTAAEIAFLALECERLGHAEIGERLLEHYRACARDDCSAALLDFYRGLRAFVRAKVAAWHLEEELPAEAKAAWQGRARWYLDAAAASLGVERRPPIARRR
jgi:aminoglycoside phosphotransferase family enzyme